MNGSQLSRTILFATLWTLAVGLLCAGLALPAIRIVRLRLFAGEHSIVGSVGLLWQGGQWLLAVAIALFSIVTPTIKLALLAWLWLGQRSGPMANRLAWFIDIIGKWSMLDVLVVAILVVGLQGGFWLRAEPRIGVWLFAAATILTMVLGSLVRRQQRR